MSPQLTDLPTYVGHKTVHAAPIKEITGPDAQGLFGVVVQIGTEPHSHTVAGPMLPEGIEPGWILVRYESGYVSFSPPEPFEEGYTQLAPLGSDLQALADAMAHTNLSYITDACTTIEASMRCEDLRVDDTEEGKMLTDHVMDGVSKIRQALGSFLPHYYNLLNHRRDELKRQKAAAQNATSQL